MDWLAHPWLAWLLASAVTVGAIVLMARRQAQGSGDGSAA
jgi:hypothetical protein